MITLHARVQEPLSLPLPRRGVDRAHSSREIARELDVARVFVHVEPFAPDAIAARDVTQREPNVYAAAVAAVREAAGADPRWSSTARVSA